MSLNHNDKIYVAGHRGLVGSAIVKQLKNKGYENIITRTHAELDLTNQFAVKDFFANNDIDYVVLAAAKVGGIIANNTYPAEFIYQNLMVASNVIHQAYIAGVKKLLSLGSSCIYPRNAPQPMQEQALLSDYLEPTNEPYALAKIAGIKLCESYNRQYQTDYRSVMPTNLYGAGDNFHPENSHVIPALIRRIHEAKITNSKAVTIWGTGKVKREFLHVDDMANACVYIMELDYPRYAENTEAMLSHINIGTGIDVSIAELAELIKKVIGFRGELVFDTTKPDGPIRKLLDVSRLTNMGWEAKIELEEGLTHTYQWYKDNIESIRG